MNVLASIESMVSMMNVSICYFYHQAIFYVVLLISGHIIALCLSVHLFFCVSCASLISQER